VFGCILNWFLWLDLKNSLYAIIKWPMRNYCQTQSLLDTWGDILPWWQQYEKKLFKALEIEQFFQFLLSLFVVTIQQSTIWIVGKSHFWNFVINLWMILDILFYSIKSYSNARCIIFYKVDPSFNLWYDSFQP